MQLSVIILNYNVCHFLHQCLLSVQKALQGIEGEIIVIDNNSQDDSCDMVAQHFPEVILIVNQENTGFPRGNNIGIAQAQGQYICILNPDTVVAEDSFLTLLDFVKDKKNFGIIGCRLIDGTGTFLPESKRNIPTPAVSLLKMLGYNKPYYASHLDEFQNGKADVFVGAFMFIETEKYRRLGGFDEAFFMYGEDIDLSYRFLLAGYDNYYVADTSIIHYKGESTLKDQTYLKRFYGAMHIFYKKHFGSNFLFNWITTLGIWGFSIVNSLKNQKPRKHIPIQYVLFSNNKTLLLQLEQTLSKPIDLVSDYNNFNPKRYLNLQTELIFDGNYLSNQNIIKLMHQFSILKFTYKILPESCDFIIGSNSKNDKGSTIKLHHSLPLP